MKLFKLSLILLLIGLGTYYIWPENQLNGIDKVDKLVVYKKNHLLEVLNKNKVIASYSISLSKNGLDKKHKCGDGLTPEGNFRVQKRTHSDFHKAIDIGYGCNVLIHGQKYGWIGKFHRWIDWTQGCIALTNSEIDELYKVISNGCPISIKP